MLLLCLVGCSQPLLGSGSPPWASSSWVMPSMWPRWGDYWSHLSPVCICKRVLVPALLMVWAPNLHPSTHRNFFPFVVVNGVNNTVGDMLRKGMNSLIILGAWTLWTHRNKCVFDGTAPNIAGALAVGEDKGKAWSLAGARGLSPPSCHCSGWLGPCLVCFFVSFCVVWPLVPFFIFLI